jgi:hypothetical protein
MPAKQGRQLRYVLGCFERVQIVRMFAEPETSRAKLIITFPVANTDAAPIVALEHDKRPGKAEPGRLRSPTKKFVEYFAHEPILCRCFFESSG